MGPVATWVRIDLRQRGRSMAVLALLVAVATAAVLSSTAGARRGASALDRLVHRTRPADLAVLPNEPGFDWDAIRALPSVETVVEFAVAGYEIEELPGDMSHDFPYIGSQLFHELERAVVLDGRLPDPARPDEAVITPAFRGTSGFGLGDAVTIHLYSPEQTEQARDDGSEPAEGARIRTTIVGVVRSPWFSDSGDAEAGRLIPSPGLYASYPDSFRGPERFINALVRLHGGAAAVPEFREQLAAATGRTDIEFFDLADGAAHHRRVTGFEARSLAAFAAAAAVASLFLVGQSVSRYAAAAAADLEVMRALGLSPRHRRIAATIEPALAASAGTAAGAALAFVLSDRFPVGTAAAFEPRPGRSLDLVVFAPGVLLVPVLVAVGALASAWHATRRQLEPSPERSSIASVVAGLGVAVPVSIGARFALEPGRGNRSVPVRPALAGAVIGVLGVVAALVVSAGVNDASSNPTRFGQAAAVVGFLGFNGEAFAPAGPVLDAVAAVPGVAAVNDSRQAVGEVGDVDVPVLSYDPVGASFPIVLLDRAAPDTAGAGSGVVIAPSSADRLGVGVGDTVALRGRDAERELVVTGIGFVSSGPHNDSADGAWVDAATYDELFDGFFKFHLIDVALVAGVDAEAIVASLGSAVGEALGDPTVGPDMFEVRPPPPGLSELRQVERLPLLLAAFLAVLAVGAVGHALATAVRRRRRDLAVLRSIGLTRAQCRWIVVVQASLLAAVGLVAGVPLGLATGRVVWRTVADNTPIQYVPPTAVWVLVLAGPVALSIANLLAAWPSQRAASVRVGHALRAE